ncbi:MAG: mechanosensitive ion channel family protein [Candidatus Izemoplasmatales bacterium]|jgi:small conductance mechanosensitive channel|nr:mechanosensitive ion channel family protein [Candidatus Izemoplasmatales bacterium]MDD3865748.1 mechanosensitive ion channel family protein [Candidatus Izemoplasmatales bacterium]
MMALLELMRPWLDSLFGSEAIITDIIIKGLFVVIWIIIAIILTIIVKPVIYHLLKLNRKISKKMALKNNEVFAIVDQNKRGETIARSLNNLVRFVIWFIVLMFVLIGFDVDVTPILASAGIVGVAIAFGTQAIIKDFVSGIFFIVEKTFLVDELVQIDGFTGTVKEIGLRTTKIEDWKGAFLIINNGNISSVINYSRDYSIAIVDIILGYENDFDNVVKSINNFINEYGVKLPEMVEAPTIVGMTEMADLHTTLRITAKCRPAEHFGVERTLRKDLIQYCQNNGLGFPFQAVTISQEADHDK